MEPAIAALAAERRTAGQIASMQSSLDAMQRYSLADKRGQQADLAFHRFMVEAAGNTALSTLADSIGAAVTWTTRYKQRHGPLPRDPADDHAAVLTAIKARDSEAARTAMSRLITLALADMNLGPDSDHRRPSVGNQIAAN